MEELVTDLRSLVGKHQVLLITGAGVSSAVTGGAPEASWVGLLESGINRCQLIDPSLPDDWAKNLCRSLRVGEPSDLLRVADEITSVLGGRRGGEYRRWLRETVGSLKIPETTEPAEVIKAIHELGVPLATTNYDGLIEEVTGLTAVTWRDATQIQRVVRGDEPGVLHLHGYWGDPESVVLGFESYGEVMGHDLSQALLRALAIWHSFLFVGFGAGLDDPNFGALRAWMRETLSGSEYRHFRLVRDDDAKKPEFQHPIDERILLIPYGATYDDLPEFLRSLAPTEKTRLVATGR